MLNNKCLSAPSACCAPLLPLHFSLFIRLRRCLGVFLLFMMSMELGYWKGGSLSSAWNGLSGPRCVTETHLYVHNSSHRPMHAWEYSGSTEIISNTEIKLSFSDQTSIKTVWKHIWNAFEKPSKSIKLQKHY